MENVNQMQSISSANIITESASLNPQTPKQQEVEAMDTQISAMTPSSANTTNLQQLHQQYFQSAQYVTEQNQISAHQHLGFNNLTPPDLPQAVLSGLPNFFYQSTQQQQTPIPQSLDNADKSALTPVHTLPKSPKASLNEPTADQNLMSNSKQNLKKTENSDDDESIRKPVYNSRGELKIHKCKRCGYESITKVEFWEHSKIHMKPGKILQCPECPFVTDLKQYLGTHILKHSNTKPFECETCRYKCESKYMLNSHLKSHSTVFQYKCANCDYETKYIHPLKLHLRKTGHVPAMVLDESGLPNPAYTIDVYGTKRGPRKRRSSAMRSIPEPPNMPSPAQITSPATSELPVLPANMSYQQEQQDIQEQQNQQDQEEQLDQQEQQEEQEEHEQLDQHEQQEEHEQQQQQQQPPNISLLSCFQMLAAQQWIWEELRKKVLENTNEISESAITNSNSTSTSSSSSIAPTANSSPSPTSAMFECRFCGIFFKDPIMHSIHMGCHSHDDAFKCNMCGEKCDSAVGLFVHMARSAHS